eukprot:267449-Chlamydomonas_euryale.AAC.4
MAVAPISLEVRRRARRRRRAGARICAAVANRDFSLPGPRGLQTAVHGLRRCGKGCSNTKNASETPADVT